MSMREDDIDMDSEAEQVHDLEQHSLLHVKNLSTRGTVIDTASSPSSSSSSSSSRSRSRSRWVRVLIVVTVLPLVYLIYLLLSDANHPLTQCIRQQYTTIPNSETTTTTTTTTYHEITSITQPILTPCTPENTPETDQHNYLITPIRDGGYNNQWDSLLYLFRSGVRLNRSVILPPFIGFDHQNMVDQWESIYNFTYTSLNVPHLRIVSYGYGMAQCHCHLFITIPVEDRDYNPYNGRCVWSNYRPVLEIEMDASTGPIQPQASSVWFFCPKKDPILSHIVLVSWLSDIVSRVVSVLSSHFVGFHLRLGDFARYCGPIDDEKRGRIANMCPTTAEIIDTIVNYCHQSCLLYHNQYQPQSTLQITCPEEQQLKNNYTCNIVLASNPSTIERVIVILNNATSAYRIDEDNERRAGAGRGDTSTSTTSSRRDRFVMPVKFHTVSSVLHDHPDILSRLRLSRQMNRKDKSILSSLELSVIEQHVLAQGTFFIGNQGSTWSRYVWVQRIVSGGYNGLYRFHPSNNCTIWTMTPRDLYVMSQISSTSPYMRERIDNNDLFKIWP